MLLKMLFHFRDNEVKKYLTNPEVDLEGKVGEICIILFIRDYIIYVNYEDRDKNIYDNFVSLLLIAWPLSQIVHIGKIPEDWDTGLTLNLYHDGFTLLVNPHKKMPSEKIPYDESDFIRFVKIVE